MTTMFFSDQLDGIALPSKNDLEWSLTVRHDHDDGSTFEDYVKVTFCLGTNLHQMCSPYFCEDQIKLLIYLQRSSNIPHISVKVKYISAKDWLQHLNLTSH